MMEINNDVRARILVDALPYIQKYRGKVVVVKYGGNAMISEELRNAVMSDVVLLSLVGIKVVLVHGGGPEISETLKAMNIESRFVDGLRYTDEKTVDVVQMVLAGKVNKSLVSLLGMQGGKALGLCGLDGGMLKAKQQKSDKDLGFVGEITEVNSEPIVNALDNGYIPVIATVASDENGQVYNVNADTAAAQIAAELKAETLLLLTDVKGLLRDRNDEETLIHKVNISEVNSLIREGVIGGGMIPKIGCVVESVRRGVKKAFIIDGRVRHSILIELLTNEGIGTMFL